MATNPLIPTFSLEGEGAKTATFMKKG